MLQGGTSELRPKIQAVRIVAFDFESGRGRTAFETVTVTATVTERVTNTLTLALYCVAKLSHEHSCKGRHQWGQNGSTTALKASEAFLVFLVSFCV